VTKQSRLSASERSCNNGEWCTNLHKLSLMESCKTRYGVSRSYKLNPEIVVLDFA
jgi:hypothetical protein